MSNWNGSCSWYIIGTVRVVSIKKFGPGDCAAIMET